MGFFYGFRFFFQFQVSFQFWVILFCFGFIFQFVARFFVYKVLFEVVSEGFVFIVLDFAVLDGSVFQEVVYLRGVDGSRFLFIQGRGLVELVVDVIGQVVVGFVDLGRGRVQFIRGFGFLQIFFVFFCFVWFFIYVGIGLQVSFESWFQFCYRF